VARVKEQMSSFLDGFGSIIPLNLIKIFDEHELELLMCGIQNILPEGWEERVHTDGRVFYIDHSGLYYIMFLALTINLTKPPLQTREPRSGRILACPIQTLPDRLCPTPEITSRNTSISRVILESL